MTREEIRAFVAASRARQGLPPTIEDLATIERIATIFRLADEDTSASSSTTALVSRQLDPCRRGT